MSSRLITIIGVLLGAGVCVAADLYRNPNFGLNYPACNVYFQDGRSAWAVFAAEEAAWPIGGGNPLDPARGIACYDPKDPPSKEVMEQLDRVMRGYAERFQTQGSRWGTNPVTITWSFVPDGVALPGGNVQNEPAGNSELFARLDAQFGAANRALWISRFQQVFDRWQALTGITYVRVRNGTSEWDDGAAWGSDGSATRGDIRIAMKRIDSAGGVLAYNQFPSGGGDMVLDRWESWQSSSNSHRFLRNVVAHEHGHGLGIAHVCPLGTGAGTWKLMEPYINNAYDGPQQDDIRAAQSLYGDPYEPNATAATASVLGTLTPGVTLTLGPVPAPAPAGASLLSISDPFDADYFKATLDQPRLVTVTVTPNGSTYGDAPQSGDCQSGSWATTNSLAVVNLALDVRSASGTATYRSVNATGAGSAETITGLLVAPAGDFTVRVYASGVVQGPQAYTLSITAATTDLSCDASDGTFTDKVRITWPGVINDATGYQVARGTIDNPQFATTIATLGAGVLSFDDTTATPGVPYYYWTRAQQPGATGYRLMQAAGEPGSRAVANQPPTANAGSDQTVTDTDNSGAEVVTLDGSGSNDPDGTITNYLWKEGAVTLASSSSPTSMVSLAVGVHTIELTVTDDDGATATDTVVMTVVSGANQPPIADAGPDQTDLVDSDCSGEESVTLDGSGSSDPDGTISNYRWAFMPGDDLIASGPSASVVASIPVGTHTIRLTVTDNRGDAATDDLIVIILPPCPADYNQDGGVDGGDVDAFFDAWSAGEPAADVNCDGGIDGGDVDAFFAAWENGGCN